MRHQPEDARRLLDAVLTEAPTNRRALELQRRLSAETGAARARGGAGGGLPQADPHRLPRRAAQADLRRDLALLGHELPVRPRREDRPAHHHLPEEQHHRRHRALRARHQRAGAAGARREHRADLPEHARQAQGLPGAGGAHLLPLEHRGEDHRQHAQDDPEGPRRGGRREAQHGDRARHARRDPHGRAAGVAGGRARTRGDAGGGGAGGAAQQRAEPRGGLARLGQRHAAAAGQRDRAGHGAEHQYQHAVLPLWLWRRLWRWFRRRLETARARR